MCTSRDKMAASGMEFSVPIVWICCCSLMKSWLIILFLHKICTRPIGRLVSQFYSSLGCFYPSGTTGRVVSSNTGIYSPHCVDSLSLGNWAVILNVSLQWRHNGQDGFSNHQPHDCLLNRLSRCRSKKTSKLCVTGLCEGNSLVTGEFPAQVASKPENVSIWWCHHVFPINSGTDILRTKLLRHDNTAVANGLAPLLNSLAPGRFQFNFR